MIMSNRNGDGRAIVRTSLDTRGSRMSPPMADSLMVVVWRNRWIMLIIQVVALAAAAVYLAKATPIYTSTSRVYVEQSGPKVFTEAEQGVMTQSKNYLHTQVELLKSSPIIVQVLEDPSIGRMKTFTACDNPVAYLKKNLRAGVGRKDDIISVSFDSAYPHEAARLVNAVVVAYSAYHENRKRSTSAEVLRILQLENASRLEELAAKRQAMTDFKQENRALAFESDRGNIVLERLTTLSAELTQAQLAAIASETTYRHAKQMLDDPAKLKQFVDVQRAKRMHTSVDAQYEELVARLRELELRLAANRVRELKAGRPAVTALEGQFISLQAQLDARNGEFAQAQLAWAEQEYLAAQDKEDQIAKHYDEQCQQAFELSGQVDQYEMMRLDWEQTKMLCDALSHRIKELRVTDNVGALNISILEVARPADKPSKPQKARILAIAQMLGLLLAGGLALLRDCLDQRLRSAEEAGAVLGTPVLGVVPSMSRRLGIVGRGQRVHRDSSSPEAEAYRTIRTALFLGKLRDDRIDR